MNWSSRSSWLTLIVCLTFDMTYVWHLASEGTTHTHTASNSLLRWTRTGRHWTWESCLAFARSPEPPKNLQISDISGLWYVFDGNFPIKSVPERIGSTKTHLATDFKMSNWWQAPEGYPLGSWNPPHLGQSHGIRNMYRQYRSTILHRYVVSY